jgi:hypothetical protein
MDVDRLLISRVETAAILSAQRPIVPVSILPTFFPVLADDVPHLYDGEADEHGRSDQDHHLQDQQ